MSSVSRPSLHQRRRYHLLLPWQDRKKDKDFGLVTDPNLHINAHFIGKRNANMGRDFTWVESTGIMFDNHKLFLGARKTSKWDDANEHLALAFDGEPIFLEETVGSQWSSTSTPQVTITSSSETNSVTVEVQGKLMITTKVVPITEEDSRVHNYSVTSDGCLAHLDLGYKFNSLSGSVDGVLGRTYMDDYVSRVNVGAAMPVMGGQDEKEEEAVNAFRQILVEKALLPLHLDGYHTMLRSLVIAPLLELCPCATRSIYELQTRTSACRPL